MLEYISKLNIVTSKIYHGFHTPGPPDSITWPTVTFVNCVYSTTVTPYLKRLGITDTVIFAREARKPAKQRARLFARKRDP
jgi:hypothetical protein